MAADPGTGAQRAVGTVRRQAALPPYQGDGLLLPTGLRLWTARPRMARSLNFLTGRQLEIQSSGESSQGLDSGSRSCENS